MFEHSDTKCSIAICIESPLSKQASIRAPPACCMFRLDMAMPTIRLVIGRLTWLYFSSTFSQVTFGSSWPGGSRQHG